MLCACLVDIVTAPARSELHNLWRLSLVGPHGEIRYRLLAYKNLLYVVLLNCLFGWLLEHLLQIENSDFVLEVQLVLFLQVSLFLAVVKSGGVFQLGAGVLSVLQRHEPASNLGVASFASSAFV